MALLAGALTACIEDGFSTSPSDQPAFSVDTLDIGTVFTDELTATHSFTVYNRHDKGMNISRIALSGPDARYFRLNVDGFSGTVFENVEIRANDSIFVFVDALLPENGQVTPQPVFTDIDFLTNGVASRVVVAVDGQDAVRMPAVAITGDAVLTAGKPYRVTDSLVVAEGAKLTLEAGTRLLFHDKSSLIVRGTLVCQGSPEAPVVITGDRMGDVIPEVSFDLMSRQWDGVLIYPSSTDNYLQWTEISNTVYGLEISGGEEALAEPQLTMVNVRLRNSGGYVFTSVNSNVAAAGCEFAEAADGLLLIAGGDYRFDRCSVSNHYLFSAITGAAWCFLTDGDDILPTNALVTNSITWGIGSDVDPGDLTGTDIRFANCLFRAAGEDDDNFIGCIWDTDPLFFTVREDYLFDYRLQLDSPAIGAADPELLSPITPELDYYGVPAIPNLPAPDPLIPNLGAYNSPIPE